MALHCFVSCRLCWWPLRPLATTLLVVLATWPSGAPRAQRRPAADALQGDIDAASVLASIQRGVAYLKREQSPRGHWDELGTYEGGVTALCTLALLNSGVERDDPVVRRALGYLRGIEPEKTYSVSLQTMALCAAEPKRDLLIIQKNVEWLEANQIREGERKGAWSYPGPGGDNSNSQFAVLALYEAQRAGARVNRQTWQLALDYWRGTQNPDGSWGYVPRDGGSGSMTCAGIGGLAICLAAIEAGDATVKDGRIVCCQPAKTDDALRRALDWMGRNFSVNRNPRKPGGGQPCLYYYLYGLERAGRLTARRFIGEHDWYREGAAYLVGAQDSLSHYWQGSWHDERRPHVSTPLALLFLSKGRRPVVLAKLKYGEDDGWNRHRNDAAHLVTHTEQAWDLPLTWQVYATRSASVEDLLQAPVLYISGKDSPDLIPQATKLRDYIDRGGFVLAEGCCSDSTQFDRGFRQLMTAVFPEEEYKLQKITPGHPIWRMEVLVRPDSPYAGRLWAVEYGCRTCVVYSERDLSCYWELAHPGRWRDHPRPAVQQISDGLAVGLNVLTYATGREPKGKEQSFNLQTDDPAFTGAGSRGVMEIIKLQHGGGCNDAPGALMNLLRTASQGELKVRISTQEKLVGIADEALFRYHLAFMHGRHDFRLTPAEQQNLGQFLQRGGTLFVDSICASKPFTAAVRRELLAMFPNQSLQRIPDDDPIWTDAYGGYNVRRVLLRSPDTTRKDRTLAVRLREVSPQLEGIRLGDRWAVVFSPHDISCALEKHEAVQCHGYTREDAARLALNILLYSLNQ